MFSIGGWLAAVMPMVGGHGSKRLPTRCPVPARDAFHAYRSITDYSGDFVDNNALATAAKTASQPLPNPCPVASHRLPTQTDTVAVRLASCDGGRLRIIADVSRAAPRDFEGAGDQFVELMRDAVDRGFLPASVPFSALRRFYDGIAVEFVWPSISDVRLSKLLEFHGCVKRVNRDRKNGRDKRTVLYRLR
jgi:hypothetical protein